MNTYRYYLSSGSRVDVVGDERIDNEFGEAIYLGDKPVLIIGQPYLALEIEYGEEQLNEG